MIRFRRLVEAIHEAVCAAIDGTKDNAEDFLQQYFDKSEEQGADANTLKPKTIKLDYPTLDDDGQPTEAIVEVPLITLVPYTQTQIEKAVFTAEFRLYVENDELLVDFPDSKRKMQNSTLGELEITIAPKESTAGVKQIIEGYETVLKRQI